jgi:hypothetical protein
MVFQKDLEKIQSENRDLNLIEVGNRAKYKEGGKSTLVGYIKERVSKNPIPEVLIYTEDKKTFSKTDENGFYALNISNGKNLLTYQYLGKLTKQKFILMLSDGQLDVELDDDIITLKEVTVKADQRDNIENTIMGIEKIDVQDTKNMPVVLGEKDIIKVATSTAGIQTVGEGAAGIHVRGGKSDQNLMLLDGATIYNSNHFFGFFSAFNSDALDGMKVYKSSMPAQYGGRLSSVFDIETKKASKEKASFIAAFSPITAKATAEIPIIKEKAGIMLGGRITYSNWILQRINNASFKENEASFSDLTGRFDYDLNEKNSIKLSAYISNDKFRLNSDTIFSFSDFSYSNMLSSLEWRHIHNKNFESKISFSSSNYGYKLLSNSVPENSFKQDFDISELTGKYLLDFFINEKHTLKAGIESKFYKVNPGSLQPTNSVSEITTKNIQREKGIETGIFLSDKYDLNKKINLDIGLRFNNFVSLGAKDVFVYEENAPRVRASVIDTLDFSENEIIKNFNGLDYRFAARYSLNKKSSIKASYNKVRQYLHSLSNAASVSPTDIWVISNYHIDPQTSDQLSLGYFQNFLDNSLETSVEFYYKQLNNLVDFKVGADFLLNNQIEADVLQGEGRSYGMELSLKKKGKLNGWINYTFARSLLRLNGDFPDEIINQGDYFPTNYDKPHTLNVVANYKLTKRVSFSLNSNFTSGRPVTYPVGTYNFKGSEVVHYSDRNSFRIPDYFRVDIGINLEEGHRVNKSYHSYWSFSVYNLLGRDNPFSVFFDVRDGEVYGYQLIVFGNPIPIVTFNLRF